MHKQPWLSLPQTLSQQILATFSIALVIILGTILGGSYYLVQISWEGKAQTHAQEVVQGLQQIAQTTPAPSLDLLQTLVESYGNLPNVLEMAVIDADAQTVLHSVAQRQDQPYSLLHPQLLARVQGITPPDLALGLSLRVQEWRHRNAAIRVVPMLLPQIQPDTPVLAIIMLDLRRLHQDIRQGFGWVMLIILGGIGLLLGVMWLLINHIVLIPLDTLREAVLRSQETNSFELKPVLPTTEIWILATTFASVFAQRLRGEMALHASEQRERQRSQELSQALAQLEERSQELQEIKGQLEERVEERTAELHNTLQNLQQVQVQLLEQEKRLRHDTLHDRLTGLPNREYLMQRLGDAIEKSRAGEGLTPDNGGYLYSVLFIDLDHFKVINDSLGHLVGDQLLQRVADRLSHALREQDVLARLGGDEFVILLDDIHDYHYALQVAERLQSRLQSPFQLQNQEVFTGASMGITHSTAGYQRPEDILRDADIAMYASKRSGKGRYSLFTTAMQESARDRLNSENNLRRALNHHEFCLYYQPIFNLETQRIVGLEALVRWQHPQHGLLLPQHFMDLAEETGLIRDLGQWVLRTACHQVQQWQTFAPESSLMLHLNWASSQLLQEDVVELIASVLTESQLPGTCLYLEIGERLLLKPSDTLTEIMGAIQALGIRICVDDFGVGHSSLQTLQDLHIDSLKVDRTFIQQLDPTATDGGMVQAIVALAHSNQMAVIAEGIETHPQLQKLKALHCELGQGLFLAAPQDGTAIAALLARHAVGANTNPEPCYHNT